MLIDVSLDEVQADEGCGEAARRNRSRWISTEFMCITDGKASDMGAARSLKLPVGNIIAEDRGYANLLCFDRLSKQEIFLVAWMKKG